MSKTNKILKIEADILNKKAKLFTENPHSYTLGDKIYVYSDFEQTSYIILTEEELNIFFNNYGQIKVNTDNTNNYQYYLYYSSFFTIRDNINNIDIPIFRRNFKTIDYTTLSNSIYGSVNTISTDISNIESLATYLNSNTIHTTYYDFFKNTTIPNYLEVSDPSFTSITIDHISLNKLVRAEIKMINGTKNLIIYYRDNVDIIINKKENYNLAFTNYDSTLSYVKNSIVQSNNIFYLALDDVTIIDTLPGVKWFVYDNVNDVPLVSQIYNINTIETNISNGFNYRLRNIDLIYNTDYGLYNKLSYGYKIINLDSTFIEIDYTGVPVKYQPIYNIFNDNGYQPKLDQAGNVIENIIVLDLNITNPKFSINPDSWVFVSTTYMKKGFLEGGIINGGMYGRKYDRIKQYSKTFKTFYTSKIENNTIKYSVKNDFMNIIVLVKEIVDKIEVSITGEIFNLNGLITNFNNVLTFDYLNSNSSNTDIYYLYVSDEIISSVSIKLPLEFNNMLTNIGIIYVNKYSIFASNFDKTRFEAQDMIIDNYSETTDIDTNWDIKVNENYIDGSNAIFNGGIFLGGYWYTGLFNSNNQITSNVLNIPGDSIWWSGLWQSGNFNGGRWFDGIWSSRNYKSFLHQDYSVIYDKTEFSSKNGGYWLGGEWRNGTHYNGYITSNFQFTHWLNGDFNGGVSIDMKWLDGKFNNGKFNEDLSYKIRYIESNDKILQYTETKIPIVNIYESGYIDGNHEYEIVNKSPIDIYNLKLSPTYIITLDQSSNASLYYSELYLRRSFEFKDYFISAMKKFIDTKTISLQNVRIPDNKINSFNRTFNTLNQFNCMPWDLDINSISVEMGGIKTNIDPIKNGKYSIILKRNSSVNLYDSIVNNTNSTINTSIFKTFINRQGLILGDQVSDIIYQKTYHHIDEKIEVIDARISNSVINRGSFLGGEINWAVMYPSIFHIVEDTSHNLPITDNNNGTITINVTLNPSDVPINLYTDLRNGQIMSFWNLNESILNENDKKILELSITDLKFKDIISHNLTFDYQVNINNDGYSRNLDTVDTLAKSNYFNNTNTSYYELFNNFVISTINWKGSKMNSGTWTDGIFLNGEKSGYNSLNKTLDDSVSLWLNGYWYGLDNDIVSKHTGGILSGGYMLNSEFTGGVLDNSFNWTLVNNTIFGSDTTLPIMLGGLVEKKDLIVDSLYFLNGSILYTKKWNNGLWGSGLDLQGRKIYDNHHSNNSIQLTDNQLLRHHLYGYGNVKSFDDKYVIFVSKNDEKSRKILIDDFLPLTIFNGSSVKIFNVNHTGDINDSKINIKFIQPHKFQEGYRFIVHDTINEDPIIKIFTDRELFVDKVLKVKKEDFYNLNRAPASWSQKNLVDRSYYNLYDSKITNSFTPNDFWTKKIKDRDSWEISVYFNDYQYDDYQKIILTNNDNEVNISPERSVIKLDSVNSYIRGSYFDLSSNNYNQLNIIDIETMSYPLYKENYYSYDYSYDLTNLFLSLPNNSVFYGKINNLTINGFLQDVIIYVNNLSPLAKNVNYTTFNFPVTTIKLKYSPFFEAVAKVLNTLQIGTFSIQYTLDSNDNIIACLLIGTDMKDILNDFNLITYQNTLIYFPLANYINYINLNNIILNTFTNSDDNVDTIELLNIPSADTSLIDVTSTIIILDTSKTSHLKVLTEEGITQASSRIFNGLDWYNGSFNVSLKSHENGKPLINLSTIDFNKLKINNTVGTLKSSWWLRGNIHNINWMNGYYGYSKYIKNYIKDALWYKGIINDGRILGGTYDYITNIKGYFQNNINLKISVLETITNLTTEMYGLEMEYHNDTNLNYNLSKIRTIVKNHNDNFNINPITTDEYFTNLNYYNNNNESNYWLYDIIDSQSTDGTPVPYISNLKNNINLNLLNYKYGSTSGGRKSKIKATLFVSKPEINMIPYRIGENNVFPNINSEWTLNSISDRNKNKKYSPIEDSNILPYSKGDWITLTHQFKSKKIEVLSISKNYPSYKIGYINLLDKSMIGINTYDLINNTSIDNKLKSNLFFNSNNEDYYLGDNNLKNKNVIRLTISSEWKEHISNNNEIFLNSNITNLTDPRLIGFWKVIKIDAKYTPKFDFSYENIYPNTTQIKFKFILNDNIDQLESKGYQFITANKDTINNIIFVSETTSNYITGNYKKMIYISKPAGSSSNVFWELKIATYDDYQSLSDNLNIMVEFIGFININFIPDNYTIEKYYLNSINDYTNIDVYLEKNEYSPESSVQLDEFNNQVKKWEWSFSSDLYFNESVESNFILNNYWIEIGNIFKINQVKKLYDDIYYNSSDIEKVHLESEDVKLRLAGQWIVDIDYPSFNMNVSRDQLSNSINYPSKYNYNMIYGDNINNSQKYFFDRNLSSNYHYNDQLPYYFNINNNLINSNKINIISDTSNLTREKSFAQIFEIPENGVVKPGSIKNYSDNNNYTSLISRKPCVNFSQKNKNIHIEYSLKYDLTTQIYNRIFTSKNNNIFQIEFNKKINKDYTDIKGETFQCYFNGLEKINNLLYFNCYFENSNLENINKLYNSFLINNNLKNVDYLNCYFESSDSNGLNYDAEYKLWEGINLIKKPLDGTKNYIDALKNSNEILPYFFNIEKYQDIKLMIDSYENYALKNNTNKKYQDINFIEDNNINLNLYYEINNAYHINDKVVNTNDLRLIFNDVINNFTINLYHNKAILLLINENRTLLNNFRVKDYFENNKPYVNGINLQITGFNSLDIFRINDPKLIGTNNKLGTNSTPNLKYWDPNYWLNNKELKIYYGNMVEITFELDHSWSTNWLLLNYIFNPGSLINLSGIESKYIIDDYKTWDPTASYNKGDKILFINDFTNQYKLYEDSNGNIKTMIPTGDNLDIITDALTISAIIPFSGSVTEISSVVVIPTIINNTTVILPEIKGWIFECNTNNNSNIEPSFRSNVLEWSPVCPLWIPEMKKLQKDSIVAYKGKIYKVKKDHTSTIYSINDNPELNTELWELVNYNVVDDIFGSQNVTPYIIHKREYRETYDNYSTFNPNETSFNRWISSPFLENDIFPEKIDIGTIGTNLTNDFNYPYMYEGSLENKRSFFTIYIRPNNTQLNDEKYSSFYSTHGQEIIDINNTVLETNYTINFEFEKKENKHNVYYTYKKQSEKTKNISNSSMSVIIGKNVVEDNIYGDPSVNLLGLEYEKFRYLTNDNYTLTINNITKPKNLVQKSKAWIGVNGYKNLKVKFNLNKNSELSIIKGIGTNSNLENNVKIFGYFKGTSSTDTLLLNNPYIKDISNDNLNYKNTLESTSDIFSYLHTSNNSFKNLRITWNSINNNWIFRIYYDIKNVSNSITQYRIESYLNNIHFNNSYNFVDILEYLQGNDNILSTNADLNFNMKPSLNKIIKVRLETTLPIIITINNEQNIVEKTLNYSTGNIDFYGNIISSGIENIIPVSNNTSNPILISKLYFDIKVSENLEEKLNSLSSSLFNTDNFTNIENDIADALFTINNENTNFNNIKNGSNFESFANIEVDFSIDKNQYIGKYYNNNIKNDENIKISLIKNATLIKGLFLDLNLENVQIGDKFGNYINDNFDLVLKNINSKSSTMNYGFWDGGKWNEGIWENLFVNTPKQAIWNRGIWLNGEWNRGHWFSMTEEGDWEDYMSIWTKGTMKSESPNNSDINEFVVNETGSKNSLVINDNNTGDNIAYISKFNRRDNNINVDYDINRENIYYDIGGSDFTHYTTWHGGCWNALDFENGSILEETEIIIYERLPEYNDYLLSYDYYQYIISNNSRSAKITTTQTTFNILGGILGGSGTNTTTTTITATEVDLIKGSLYRYRNNDVINNLQLPEEKFYKSHFYSAWLTDELPIYPMYSDINLFTDAGTGTFTTSNGFFTSGNMSIDGFTGPNISTYGQINIYPGLPDGVKINNDSGHSLAIKMDYANTFSISIDAPYRMFGYKLHCAFNNTTTNINTLLNLIPDKVYIISAYVLQPTDTILSSTYEEIRFSINNDNTNQVEVIENITSKIGTNLGKWVLISITFKLKNTNLAQVDINFGSYLRLFNNPPNSNRKLAYVDSIKLTVGDGVPHNYPFYSFTKSKKKKIKYIKHLSSTPNVKTFNSNGDIQETYDYSYGEYKEGSYTDYLKIHTNSKWLDGVWMRGKWNGGIYYNGRFLSLKAQDSDSYNKMSNIYSTWYRGAFYGYWYAGTWHSLRGNYYKNNLQGYYQLINSNGDIVKSINDTINPEEYDKKWKFNTEKIYFSNFLITEEDVRNVNLKVAITSNTTDINKILNRLFLDFLQNENADVTNISIELITDIINTNTDAAFLTALLNFLNSKNINLNGNVASVKNFTITYINTNKNIVSSLLEFSKNYISVDSNYTTIISNYISTNIEAIKKVNDFFNRYIYHLDNNQNPPDGWFEMNHWTFNSSNDVNKIENSNKTIFEFGYERPVPNWYYSDPKFNYLYKNSENYSSDVSNIYDVIHDTPYEVEDYTDILEKSLFDKADRHSIFGGLASNNDIFSKFDYLFGRKNYPLRNNVTLRLSENNLIERPAYWQGGVWTGGTFMYSVKDDATITKGLSKLWDSNRFVKLNDEIQIEANIYNNNSFEETYKYYHEFINSNTSAAKKKLVLNKNSGNYSNYAPFTGLNQYNYDNFGTNIKETEISDYRRSDISDAAYNKLNKSTYLATNKSVPKRYMYLPSIGIPTGVERYFYDFLATSPNTPMYLYLNSELQDRIGDRDELINSFLFKEDMLDSLNNMIINDENRYLDPHHSIDIKNLLAYVVNRDGLLKRVYYDNDYNNTLANTHTYYYFGGETTTGSGSTNNILFHSYSSFIDINEKKEWLGSWLKEPSEEALPNIWLRGNFYRSLWRNGLNMNYLNLENKKSKVKINSFNFSKQNFNQDYEFTVELKTQIIIQPDIILPVQNVLSVIVDSINGVNLNVLESDIIITAPIINVKISNKKITQLEIVNIDLLNVVHSYDITIVTTNGDILSLTFYFDNEMESISSVNSNQYDLIYSNTTRTKYLPANVESNISTGNAYDVLWRPYTYNLSWTKNNFQVDNTKYYNNSHYYVLRSGFSYDVIETFELIKTTINSNNSIKITPVDDVNTIKKITVTLKNPYLFSKEDSVKVRNFYSNLSKNSYVYQSTWRTGLNRFTTFNESIWYGGTWSNGEFINSSWLSGYHDFWNLNYTKNNLIVYLPPKPIIDFKDETRDIDNLFIDFNTINNTSNEEKGIFISKGDYNLHMCVIDYNTDIPSNVFGYSNNEAHKPYVIPNREIKLEQWTKFNNMNQYSRPSGYIKSEIPSLRFVGNNDNYASSWMDGMFLGSSFNGGIWNTGEFYHLPENWYGSKWILDKFYSKAIEISTWSRGIWLSGIFSFPFHLQAEKIGYSDEWLRINETMKYDTVTTIASKDVVVDIHATTINFESNNLDKIIKDISKIIPTFKYESHQNNYNSQMGRIYDQNTNGPIITKAMTDSFMIDITNSNKKSLFLGISALTESDILNNSIRMNKFSASKIGVDQQYMQEKIEFYTNTYPKWNDTIKNWDIKDSYDSTITTVAGKDIDINNVRSSWFNVLSPNTINKEWEEGDDTIPYYMNKDTYSSWFKRSYVKSEKIRQLSDIKYNLNNNIEYNTNNETVIKYSSIDYSFWQNPVHYLPEYVQWSGRNENNTNYFSINNPSTTYIDDINKNNRNYTLDTSGNINRITALYKFYFNVRLFNDTDKNKNYKLSNISANPLYVSNPNDGYPSVINDLIEDYNYYASYGINISQEYYRYRPYTIGFNYTYPAIPLTTSFYSGFDYDTKGNQLQMRNGLIADNTIIDKLPNNIMSSKYQLPHNRQLFMNSLEYSKFFVINNLDKNYQDVNNVTDYTTSRADIYTNNISKINPKEIEEKYFKSLNIIKNQSIVNWQYRFVESEFNGAMLGGIFDDMMKFSWMFPNQITEGERSLYFTDDNTFIIDNIYNYKLSDNTGNSGNDDDHNGLSDKPRPQKISKDVNNDFNFLVPKEYINNSGDFDKHVEVYNFDPYNNKSYLERSDLKKLDVDQQLFSGGYRDFDYFDYISTITNLGPSIPGVDELMNKMVHSPSSRNRAWSKWVPKWSCSAEWGNTPSNLIFHYTFTVAENEYLLYNYGINYNREISNNVNDWPNSNGQGTYFLLGSIYNGFLIKKYNLSQNEIYQTQSLNLNPKNITSNNSINNIKIKGYYPLNSRMMKISTDISNENKWEHSYAYLPMEIYPLTNSQNELRKSKIFLNLIYGNTTIDTLNGDAKIDVNAFDKNFDFQNQVSYLNPRYTTMLFNNNVKLNSYHNVWGWYQPSTIFVNKVQPDPTSIQPILTKSNNSLYNRRIENIIIHHLPNYIWYYAVDVKSHLKMLYHDKHVVDRLEVVKVVGASVEKGFFVPKYLNTGGMTVDYTWSKIISDTNLPKDRIKYYYYQYYNIGSTPYILINNTTDTPVLTEITVYDANGNNAAGNNPMYNTSDSTSIFPFPYWDDLHTNVYSIGGGVSPTEAGFRYLYFNGILTHRAQVGNNTFGYDFTTIKIDAVEYTQWEFIENGNPSDSTEKYRKKITTYYLNSHDQNINARNKVKEVNLFRLSEYDGPIAPYAFDLLPIYPKITSDSNFHYNLIENTYTNLAPNSWNTYNPWNPTTNQNEFFNFTRDILNYTGGYNAMSNKGITTKLREGISFSYFDERFNLYKTPLQYDNISGPNSILYHKDSNNYRIIYGGIATEFTSGKLNYINNTTFSLNNRNIIGDKYPYWDNFLLQTNLLVDKGGLNRIWGNEYGYSNLKLKRVQRCTCSMYQEESYLGLNVQGYEMDRMPLTKDMKFYNNKFVNNNIEYLNDQRVFLKNALNTSNNNLFINDYLNLRTATTLNTVKMPKSHLSTFGGPTFESIFQTANEDSYNFNIAQNYQNLRLKYLYNKELDVVFPFNFEYITLMNPRNLLTKMYTPYLQLRKHW